MARLRAKVSNRNAAPLTGTARVRVHRDQIPGGKADYRNPADFDQNELKMGIAVEMEHTRDPRIAIEIAMDHLAEDPRYYTKLRTIHHDENDVRVRGHIRMGGQLGGTGQLPVFDAKTGRRKKGLF